MRLTPQHLFCLQLTDSSAPSTVVVKIVKISPSTAPCRNPDSQHTVSILDHTNEARISFSAVYQPCNLLERPKVHTCIIVLDRHIQLHTSVAASAWSTLPPHAHMSWRFADVTCLLVSGVSPRCAGVSVGARELSICCQNSVGDISGTQKPVSLPSSVRHV